MSAHGTRSRYVHGCHCKKCREANRLYHEQRRRAMGVQPQRRGATHGRAWTYRQGCRCDACRNAHTFDCRERSRWRNDVRRPRRADQVCPYCGRTGFVLVNVHITVMHPNERRLAA